MGLLAPWHSPPWGPPAQGTEGSRAAAGGQRTRPGGVTVAGRGTHLYPGGPANPELQLEP